MSIILLSILILLLIILVIGIIWLARLSYLKEDEEYLKGNFCQNKAPSLSEGYGYGIEKVAEQGKDGDWLITFSPIDIDTNEVLLKDGEIHDIKFVVRKGLRKVRPMGGSSQRQNVVEYYPPSPEYLIEELKGTPEGKAIMQEVEKTIIENNEVQALREQRDRANESLVRNAGGEHSAEEMESLRAFATDVKNLVSDDKDKKSSSGFGGIGSGGN